MISGGKCCVSSPPAFSNDAKRLLICTGNTVSIFSTTTGLQVAALEGHTALVTSVIVVPASNAANKVLCNCWTSSVDGTIRYWDFSLSELMKTIDIRFPIYSMVIPSFLSTQEESNAKSPKLFAYVSVEDKKEKENQHNALHGQIRKCNLTKDRLSGGVILKEAQGGGLAFIQEGPLSLELGPSDEKSPEMLLAYINGDHEYVVFYSYGTDAREINSSSQNGIVAEEETELIGYASIYGKLPELDVKRLNEQSWVSTAPSERPWETIFSGSSHNLPPLTKLCSQFLESLLEK